MTVFENFPLYWDKTEALAVSQSEFNPLMYYSDNHFIHSFVIILLIHYVTVLLLSIYFLSTCIWMERTQ